MNKGKRRLMTDDIATFQRLNPFPAPNAFTPRMGFVHKAENACVVSKSERTSLYEESVWKGQQTPAFHTKNYKQIETRIKAPSYKKRIKPDSDVACFLKVADPATKLISPATYNALDSFKSTQTKNLKFVLRSRKKDSIDMAMQRSK